MNTTNFKLRQRTNIFSDSSDFPNYGGNYSNDLPGPSETNISFSFAQADSSPLPLTSISNTEHDELKNLLESNKDNHKIDAMKRLISMIANGRVSSDNSSRKLFAHVVKNVITKNVELKKMVYIYLTRYAEQEQDLALLSVSSFQRSLKDPNPLIRASALRVLSSIRVPMISPIVLIAISDCSNDMSPYVRKTAAHAIPKLYNLDPDSKPGIINIIERLLQDKTPLVLGSAIIAFEEVCPDRLDLIHPNYRKFVCLLPDCDEWGQAIMVKMLTRYARTQFCDPNRHLNCSKESNNNYKKKSNDNSDEEEEDDEKDDDDDDDDDDEDDDDDDDCISLDFDHRMLLRNVKPLLQSRNSSIVMSVIQLYLYLAPETELNSLIIKPFIRLLHSRAEVQIVVLSNIATLTSSDSSNEEKKLKLLFEPHLKSFFIKARDSTRIKLFKLQILTNLSNSSNIPLILREFQAYINNYQNDVAFVSAIIQSIGKCSCKVKEVASVCLNGLINLLSNSNEAIVAQSVIVLRTQIMNRENVENENEEKADSLLTSIIRQMIRLVNKIETPNARATILWILAEFCDKNETSLQMSPDILRIFTKTYANEANLVKLQVMNLASKLYLKLVIAGETDMNEKDRAKIKVLINYIFNLAKYDINYDVRDRGRFLKSLLNKCDTVDGIKLANRLLMSPKKLDNEPKKTEPSQKSSFIIGSLSHFLGRKVPGYNDLPEFPKVQPDPSVRKKFEEDLTKGTIFETIGDKKEKVKEFYTSESSTETSNDETENEEESTNEDEIDSERESDNESDSESECGSVSENEAESKSQALTDEKHKERKINHKERIDEPS